LESCLSLKDATFKTECPKTPTVLFDDLLDSAYPVLNQLHGVNRSRRFWSILLHRYLALWIYYGGKVPDRPSINTTRRSSRLRWLRDARYFPGEARRRAATAYLLRSPLLSARSILTGFHENCYTIARLVDQPASWLPRNKFHGTRDLAVRNVLGEMIESIDAPLARMALEGLPASYVEYFRGVYESVQVADASAKEFHASYLVNIETQMTVARHVEEGSRLTFYQHSAEYGELCNYVWHHAQAGLADRFRTWGWKLHKNDEPYLALRLMKPARLLFRTKSGSGTWLYVIVRSRHIETTHSVQRRFFGVLSDRGAATIVIRPRILKADPAENQIIDGVRSRVQSIDDGYSRMVDLVREAELVILDGFPSTAFMECVTADVPVIAIVPEGTAFTETAGKFYDEFFRIGLLQRSPELAGDFLNGLSVGSWWRDVRQLDCFREYLSTFCNMDVSRTVV
jgi:putative transferase (TIGR04331 family)